MSLARDLVRLEEELRTAGVDVFRPADRPLVKEVVEASGVVEQVNRHCPTDAFGAASLALRALRVQHSLLEDKLLTAELVATLPDGVPGNARPTSIVVREMLRPPVKEVILLGYEMTDSGLVSVLSETAASGAEVVIICDRQRNPIERLAAQWPPHVRKPRIFYDRPREGSAPYASMHAMK